MAPRSTSLSKKGPLPLLRARILSHADKDAILSCGADPASLPYMVPKLAHRNLLIEGVKLFAANILKQTMLSIGGDVAVHRSVISGKVETSDCLVMGDLRHFRLLVRKLRLQGCVEDLAGVIEEQVFRESAGLELSLCFKTYSWDVLPVIMGILNVTPDSFSDGGAWKSPGEAVERGVEMAGQGAGIIDVGGESTRPGSGEVDEEVEAARVVPVIRELASRVSAPISVDTRKATVAQAAIEAGACLVNDVSAGCHDPGMLDLVAGTGAGIVLMHMRGKPGTMQEDTTYADVVSEVYAFLHERVGVCLEKGISAGSILVDPGIGFGKDAAGNLAIVRAVAEFGSLGVPVVLGHSRKSFIGAVLDAPVNERQEGTDAVSAWAVTQGVDVLRVHDVLRTRRVRDMILAVENRG